MFWKHSKIIDFPAYKLYSTIAKSLLLLSWKRTFMNSIVLLLNSNLPGCVWTFLLTESRLWHFRPQRRESAGGRLRERAAAARLYAAKDCGAGAQRGPTLRHLPHPPGLQRLRLQNFGQVNIKSYNLFNNITIVRKLII